MPICSVLAKNSDGFTSSPFVFFNVAVEGMVETPRTVRNLFTTQTLPLVAKTWLNVRAYKYECQLELTQRHSGQ